MLYKNATGEAIDKISWKAPVTRTDLTLYDATEHAGYELGILHPGEAEPLAHIFFPALYNTTEWPLAELSLSDGRHELYLRTVDTHGLVSEWSDPIVVEVNFAPPGKPLEVKGV
jgi:hypothetical protein